ncbi:MAG: phosphatidylglycerol lysyltransferase domain-containing protein [Pseudomonadota bacterium]
MSKEIPKFPKFRPISIGDAPFFYELFHNYPPLISEYTFTNLFTWTHEYDFQVCKYNGTVLILTKACGLGGLYPPVGKWNHQDIFNILKESKQAKVADHFHCADEKMIDKITKHSKDLEIDQERDHFDYVYTRDDLVNLAGRRFHNKKNLLNQFEKKYDAYFEPLTTENVAEALKFEHDWCLSRECEKNPTLSKETCSIYQMLTHFEVLKLTGAVVRYKGKIIGLTMGEPLNKNTFTIHVEKGNYHYRGIYQFINQRFAQTIDPKYTWINREQDLGIPGLRKAKESYNPIRMEKKYTIRFRGTK